MRRHPLYVIVITASLVALNWSAVYNAGAPARLLRVSGLARMLPLPIGLFLVMRSAALGRAPSTTKVLALWRAGQQLLFPVVVLFALVMTGVLAWRFETTDWVFLASNFLMAAVLSAGVGVACALPLAELLARRPTRPAA